VTLQQLYVDNECILRKKSTIIRGVERSPPT